MFSVLLKYARTGREIIIPAKTVELVPPTEDNPKAKLLINHGVEAEGGCAVISLEERIRVFVMNEHGNTVANYLL